MDRRIADPKPPPEERPPEMQQLKDGMLDVIFAAQNTSGTTNPTTRRCGASCATACCPKGQPPRKPTSSLPTWARLTQPNVHRPKESLMAYTFA